MEHAPTTPQPTRRAVGSKVAGALIGAVAALSVGGVALAFAQEAEPPTTDAPATGTPATPEVPTDEDCPDKPGRGGADGTAGAEV